MESVGVLDADADPDDVVCANKTPEYVTPFNCILTTNELSPFLASPENKKIKYKRNRLREAQ